jgi:hypothetical protein
MLSAHASSSKTFYVFGVRMHGVVTELQLKSDAEKTFMPLSGGKRDVSQRKNERFVVQIRVTLGKQLLLKV